MSEIQNLDLHHFGQEALDSWRNRGATAVEFFCVGSTAQCTYSKAIAIDQAIETWGAGTPLVMLARRARCRSCGKVGCDVQVSFRPFSTRPEPPPYIDVREARKALRR